MLPNQPEVTHLIAAYGAWTVGAVVAVESMGIPLPGETTLITAALYAGATGRMGIGSVVLAAAIGAVVGDNFGFTIGRTAGYRWLLRHGAAMHVTPRRLKLGHYLFWRHGGAVVFFGRFVALLRALAAFLAGVNRMRWPRFLVFNAAGAVVWAGLYGFGAYWFGQAITRIATPVAISLLVATLVLAVLAVRFARRHEERLENEAERNLPDAPGN